MINFEYPMRTYIGPHKFTMHHVYSIIAICCRDTRLALPPIAALLRCDSNLEHKLQPLKTFF